MAFLALALMSASPAPKATEIPVHHLGDEALIIPAGSPLRFDRIDSTRYAHFRGRFTLTGTFIYGCNIECDPPLKKDQIYVAIVPDRAMAAVLPHWKVRGGDMSIYLIGGERLANQIVTRKEQEALLAGKIPEVRRHVAIIVDDFQAGIECDSPSYAARFVAIAKPPKLVTGGADGLFGCG